jgi:hypothetical protein
VVVVVSGPLSSVLICPSARDSDCETGGVLISGRLLRRGCTTWSFVAGLALVSGALEAPSEGARDGDSDGHPRMELKTFERLINRDGKGFYPALQHRRMVGR